MGANLQGAYFRHANLQGVVLENAYLQGAYAGENFKDFVELTGRLTQLSLLGNKKFTPEKSQKVIKIIKYYNNQISKEEKTEWINLVNQAVGKTSLEWLEMQKGKYITGVLTWEEACKIQKDVTSPVARKFMGLDEVNWEEKCKGEMGERGVK